MQEIFKMKTEKLKTLKDIEEELLEEEKELLKEKKGKQATEIKDMTDGALIYMSVIKEEAMKWYEYYCDEENSFPLAYRMGCLRILSGFFNLIEEDLK